jgi:hypothetical protein
MYDERVGRRGCEQGTESDIAPKELALFENENGRNITRRVSPNNDGEGTFGTDSRVRCRARHVIWPDNTSNDQRPPSLKNLVNGAMFL